ncbi:MAG: type II toxin-antitoxin system HicA family toxin [Candidatus ainarchaeum sp.]|nr:type II toxin-antitoxin system HicA family toxin [Candidatus ainarchaeum sp.]
MNLKPVSGKDLVKLLCKKGYYIRDQKGSHIHLRHPTKSPITIPNHDVIAKGTLKAIIKITEINETDFK